MTLGEFAYVLDAKPKWIQNAAASLGHKLRFTLPGARRLAIARALTESLAMPLPRAFALAERALRDYDGTAASVSMTAGDDIEVRITIDVHRILARVSTGVSRLRTHYAPRQRGRPRTAREPIRAAEDYGLDVGLLKSNLRRSPTERLRQLDAMMDFRRRVRRHDV